MASLNLSDIEDKFQEKISSQDYSKKPAIDGVKIVELKQLVGEDGDFCELLHLDNGLIEGFEGFSLAQVNRSLMIPGTIKAWHLHLRQDEIWYLLPNDKMLVGLYDLRKDSLTKEKEMKLLLGGGKHFLLYIPKGVAHGARNLLPTPANLFYFVDQKFNQDDPDEQRLAWDFLGKDFWEIKKG